MKLVSVSTMASMALAAPQDAVDLRRGSNSGGITMDQLAELAGNILGQYRNTGISNHPGAMATDADLEDGYGCWCYWGAQNLENLQRGVPLDDLDRWCYNLAKGYDCVLMDDETCTPWATDYIRSNADTIVTQAGAGNTNQARVANFCEVDNPGNDQAAICAQMSCKVETWFAVQVYVDNIANGIDENIALDIQNANTAYFHTIKDNSVFPVVTSENPEWANLGGTAEMCAKSVAKGYDAESNPNEASVIHACCGTYPERYPYNQANRQCCSDQAAVETVPFNVATHQCCTDGSLQEIGNDCP